MTQIKIMKLFPQAITPTKATEGAAGYDLYLPNKAHLLRGRQILKLDIAIELPHGYVAVIAPRSGNASKGLETVTGDRVNADVLHGYIDSDYRGNVGVIVHNHGKAVVLPAGYRIAQMFIKRVEDVAFEEVSELSETARGDGGFGSTGTR